MVEWDTPYDKNGRIKTIGFRPSTEDAYRENLRLKWISQDLGTDTCYLYSVFAQSFNAFNDGITNRNPKALLGANIFNVQMNIQSNYCPQVSRREPLNITNHSIPGTVISRCIEAHILLKALRMPSTFSLLDFPELSSNSFKKAIQRLKRQELIEPMEPRTNPRFYRLTLKFLIPLAKEHGYKISEFNHGAPTEWL